MNTISSTMSTRSITPQLEEIEKMLGAPTYRCADVLLYHGDCQSMMAKIKKPVIPLTITSPPYNIGKEYEKVRSVDEYVEWCESWIRDIWDITAPTGSFWLNLGYLNFPGKALALPIAYLLWDRTPFYLLQEIVWNYGAGVACRQTFSPRNEKFLWFAKNENNHIFNLDAVRDPNVKYPNQKKNGKLKCNPIGKNPSDVWQFPKVTSGRNRASRERTAHPAQFPTALIERIIKACSNPGDIIFDPFIGSGSTAEAAIRTGRKALGFEIRKDYIDLAGKRLDYYWKNRRREEAQARLF